MGVVEVEVVWPGGMLDQQPPANPMTRAVHSLSAVDPVAILHTHGPPAIVALAIVSRKGIAP
jgi:hypothetical protein